MNQSIPEAALEAALEAYRLVVPFVGTERAMIDALSAAAPHLHRAAYDSGFIAAVAMQKVRYKLD